MTVIRHGLADIYKFCIHEFGCELLLVGRRFGKNRAVLDDWLGILPEITNPRMISHRRPLTLAKRTLDFDKRKSMTESEYKMLQERRRDTREWIESYYKPFDKPRVDRQDRTL